MQEVNWFTSHVRYVDIVEIKIEIIKSKTKIKYRTVGILKYLIKQK
jgi:hypothetical protein